MLVRSRDDLLRKVKNIHIPLYGSVQITMLAQCFIDNRYFQRLRELKQLGACEYIFPGASHTRFEHSIGTYYLANRIVQRLATTTDPANIARWLGQIPELQGYDRLDHWVGELVGIAALCHDIGHGPWSHIFDDLFVEQSACHANPMASHEARSCDLIRQIIAESPLLSAHIDAHMIGFIQSLIAPNHTHQGFVYQIVSNNLNGLDVDKYDYICRDSHHIGIKNGFDPMKLVDAVLCVNNNIVYPEQAEQDIYNLFMTRHMLHRRVYGHKGVVSAQHIVIQIMRILDPLIGLGESIGQPDRFVRMTDQYIINYADFVLDARDSGMFQGKISEQQLDELAGLKHRLQTHTLYPHIGTIVSKQSVQISEYFDSAEYIVYRSKVGFVSGNKNNPLDMIYVYRTKDLLDGQQIRERHIDKNEISHIIPDIYQEHITMIYRRDRDPLALARDKKVFLELKNQSSRISAGVI
jgi:HD superfamily phosphohydrolase